MIYGVSLRVNYHRQERFECNENDDSNVRTVTVEHAWIEFKLITQSFKQVQRWHERKGKSVFGC